MPQPLKRWPKKVLLGAEALDERPALALHIAKVCAAWTEIDVLLGALLSWALGAESRIGTRMYLALTGTAAQEAALAAALNEKLPTQFQARVSEALARSKGPRRERNDIVHALWGASDEHPKALIRMPPETAILWFSDTLDLHLASGDFNTEPEFTRLSRTYNEKDFKAITFRIAELHTDLESLISEIAERTLQVHSQRGASQAQPPEAVEGAVRRARPRTTRSKPQ